MRLGGEGGSYVQTSKVWTYMDREVGVFKTGQFSWTSYAYRPIHKTVKNLWKYTDELISKSGLEHYVHFLEHFFKQGSTNSSKSFFDFCRFSQVPSGEVCYRSRQHMCKSIFQGDKSHMQIKHLIIRFYWLIPCIWSRCVPIFMSQLYRRLLLIIKLKLP